MKFLAIACLAFLAAVASADSDAWADLHPLFGNSRITNGQNAIPNSLPWQVSLQWGIFAFNRNHVCGGSIIGSLWVVTAAHCFTELPNVGTFQVLAGRHFISSGSEPTQQSRNIDRRFIHPAYLGGVNPHDIALIRVNSPFIFNDAVAPIALPAKDFVHSGLAVLSGWGSTSLTTGTVTPNALQTAIIPIIETQSCYNALSSIISSPPLVHTALDNVCAGTLDESRISACSGDSGGPLAQQSSSGVWELVGVVSWGIFPCGAIGAPSVFVRTSAYIDWISEQTAQA